MVLTEANTYQGSTLVNFGTLEIRHSLALGFVDAAPAPVTPIANTSVHGTAVAANATLRLVQPAGGASVAVPGEVLTLTGSQFSTVNSGFALQNSSGDNSWSGPVVLANGVVGGVVLIDTASDLTLLGSVLNLLTSANPVGLTKSGAGTLQLGGSDANAYGGTTTILAGTLELNKTAAAALTANVVIGNLATGAGVL